MPDPSPQLESAATADGLTEDRWLGGRLTLLQPKRGHRVGTDAALLVAAAGDPRQGRIVDVGAGVGAVGLALAERNSPLASVDLVEIDPELAAARRKQCGAQWASGAHAGLAARRAQSQGAPGGGAGRIGQLRRHQPAVLRRRRRSASLRDEGKARAHVLPREAGARLPTGFRPRSRCSRRAAGL